MGDFTVEPENNTNKNQVAPLKRPLSSMSPVFYQDACRLVILGTPGGQRIPTMQFLMLAGMLQNLPLRDDITLPRFHQSFMPDILEVESQGFSDNLLDGLRQKGHAIKKMDRQYGDMQAASFNRCTQEVTAVSDPRGVGFAVVF